MKKDHNIVFRELKNYWIHNAYTVLRYRGYGFESCSRITLIMIEALVSILRFNIFTCRFYIDLLHRFFSFGIGISLQLEIIAVSYTHLTLPTIYSV